MNRIFNIKTSAIALILVFIAISCDKTPEVPDPTPIKLGQKGMLLMEADNSFAFDIFSRLASEGDKTENMMISPLSISLALAMTYNGADGETKAAMEEAMYLSGLTTEEINNTYKTLIKALLSVDPKVRLEIANSIWYRNSYYILPEFIDINKEYYDAEVSPLDFNDPSSVNTINKWVSDNTNGKIDEIIKNIGGDDIMYLINALYFKGEWWMKFDKAKTRSAPFMDENYNILGNVDMMNMEGKVWHGGNEYCEAVEMLYGSGNYGMVVMLPRYGVSLDSLAGSFNKSSLDDLDFYETDYDFKVSIPKFRFEYEKELKEVLSDMGMAEAFDDLEANFTKMNPAGTLFIGKVKHKTYVEVNEEGTEAAAVTSVTMMDKTAAMAFRADKPFLFLIRERTTGAILFIGRFSDPN